MARGKCWALRAVYSYSICGVLCACYLVVWLDVNWMTVLSFCMWSLALVKTRTRPDRKSDGSEQERQSSPMRIVYVRKWALFRTTRWDGSGCTVYAYRNPRKSWQGFIQDVFLGGDICVWEHLCVGKLISCGHRPQAPRGVWGQAPPENFWNFKPSESDLRPLGHFWLRILTF